MPEVRLVPPPRHVPWSVRVVNMLQAGAFFAWLFLGVGTMLFWGIAMHADLSPFTLRGPMSRADGVVTRDERISMGRGSGSMEAYRYSFSVAGRPYSGVSFTNVGIGFGEGHHVVVEYVTGDPSRSRIVGMRRDKYSAAAALVTIVPLLGLWAVFSTMRTGSRRVRVLCEGILSAGVLSNQRETLTTVNNRRVWEMTFSFRDQRGLVHQVSIRTTEPEKVREPGEQPLLYDPEDPDRAVLLSEGAAHPEVDDRGELRPWPVAAAFALLVPFAVVAGNVIVAMHRFGLWR